MQRFTQQCALLCSITVFIQVTRSATGSENNIISSSEAISNIPSSVSTPKQDSIGNSETGVNDTTEQRDPMSVQNSSSSETNGRDVFQRNDAASSSQLLSPVLDPASGTAQGGQQSEYLPVRLRCTNAVRKLTQTDNANFVEKKDASDPLRANCKIEFKEQALMIKHHVDPFRVYSMSTGLNACSGVAVPCATKLMHGMPCILCSGILEGICCPSGMTKRRFARCFKPMLHTIVHATFKHGSVLGAGKPPSLLTTAGEVV